MHDPDRLSSPSWYPRDRVAVAGAIDRVASPSLRLVGEYVAARRPLVVTDALVGSAALRWTDRHLADAAGDARCRLFVSRTGQFPGLFGPDFDRGRYRRIELPLGECIERLSGAATLPPVAWPEERYYLYQQPMTDGMRALIDDVRFPAWAGIDRGRGQTNIWISQRGNLTPPHVDFKENVLFQVRGRKHVLLWDAAQYPSLSLSSFRSVHAAHSEVDVTAPDLARFPLFARARALEAWIAPGEALLIPFDAIHCVHSDDFCVSINHWSETSLAVQLRRVLVSPIRRYLARNVFGAVRAGLADRRQHRAGSSVCARPRS